MMLALQGQRPSTVIDNLTATPGGGQNAIPLRGGGHRFVFVRTSGDSACLPWLLGHDAIGTREVVVINDAPNSMTVVPWVGDSLNGVTNGSLSVPAGSVAVIIKVEGAAPDWRAGIIS
jgi:hypothetical protein